MVTVTGVSKNSLAERIGVRAGDKLVSLNGNEIGDVLDYRYYLAEETVTISLLRNGETLALTVKKDTYDDIGLLFETPLMDKKHSCKNKCIFCFIDQLPKGLRETLYFKDDDSRLSFLHGNYITLTNMTDKDIDRIVKMRFSPINISVHTTNPTLRVAMMKNPRAGEVLSYIGRIADAGLSIHAQIVLCKGWNDGEELLRTMRDLSRYHEAIDSVSVVPAGLTRFREGLTPLSPYTKEEAREIISAVDAFGNEMKQKYGSRIFACADELYIRAEMPLPEEDYYEGYPQIENGVGMMTSMEDEVAFILDDIRENKTLKAVTRRVSVATGTAAYEYMKKLSGRVAEVFPNIAVDVYEVKNRFFGESVTVAGLLTGKDYKEQLGDKPLGDALLLSETSLRNEDGLFLCGMTKDELSESLGVPVILVEASGASFLSALFGREV